MSRSQQLIAIINLDACHNEDAIALELLFLVLFKKGVATFAQAIFQVPGMKYVKCSVYYE